MTVPLSTIVSRRHDLDALRAMAMLSGIVLHAALSFVPMGWIVQDSHQHSVFGTVLAALHGFRMPLFFLLSGFFTTMLWRKRGLGSLLWHRFRRIALPLLLGVFTIIPLLNWTREMATRSTIQKEFSEKFESDVSDDIWGSVRKGDVDAVARYLDDGFGLQTRNSGSGQTPLSMAALFGQAEVVGLLLERGADVRQRTKDFSTPLHNAAFFGHPQIARTLIDCGANTTARNLYLQTPVDTLSVDWETTKFIAGLVGFKTTRERLQEGRTAIANTFGVSIDPMPDKAQSVEQDGKRYPDFSELVRALQWNPFFHHLWFLWFLCWLIVGFALYALVIDRFKWTVPAGWLLSPARLLWLIPLAMIPQWFMGRHSHTFGPDTSSGLLPMARVLLYYAIFFGFGVLYYDANDKQGRVGRWWWISIPMAVLIVFPLGLKLTYGDTTESIALTPSLPKFAVDMLQVSYAWLMTFGLMGLFRRLLCRESKLMRYLSDSSYWLYVIHLPLVIWLQLLVRDWPLPALVKFALIMLVCTGVSLISYQYLVRYTPLGTLLNGKRTREKKNAGTPNA